MISPQVVASASNALVVNFRDIITAINRNGDAVFALMIGKPAPGAQSSSAGAEQGTR